MSGSLVISFLLGGHLEYVLLELRWSDIYDSLMHVLCTRLGLTIVSLSVGHVERMDRHIIMVLTWEDIMGDWVIIWNFILFENVIGHSR